MADPTADPAAPPKKEDKLPNPEGDRQRFTYVAVNSLESPTTFKPVINGVPVKPGVQEALFPESVNVADLILERNTGVRAISAFFRSHADI
jgi:hypothetical protein